MSKAQSNTDHSNVAEIERLRDDLNGVIESRDIWHRKYATLRRAVDVALANLSPGITAHMLLAEAVADCDHRLVAPDESRLCSECGRHDGHDQWCSAAPREEQRGS